MESKPKLIRITTIQESLYKLLEGQLEYMDNNGFEVIGISSPLNGYKKFEKNDNIRIIEVRMTRVISPFKDLKSIWVLYRIFKSEKPLIVHTHTPKAGFVGMCAAWFANVPHRLHTVAGLPLLNELGVKKLILEIVEKVTYSLATMVYTNSFGLRGIIISNKYINEAKIKVIANGSSNGINTSFFNPNIFSESDVLLFKKKLGLSKKDFIFLFVGRIVKSKGINELVTAFEEVNNDFPNTKLVLVGSFENELDPISADVQIAISNNKNILYIGHQSDVRPYFSVADVFTFPTYREGFPNVLLQACAMGIPSIVTDINGCNEIITDNFNGIIIPSKNIEILKNKMLLVINDCSLRSTLAKNCRTSILENYERSYVWNQIHSEYIKVINSKIKNQ